MTKMTWDQVGTKVYETGLDRGVLYLANGFGVPWNGLVSVDEDLSSVEVAAFYFEGVKYLETRQSGDFSGSLKAITYPDEFLLFDGLEEITNGMLLGNQPVYDTFGLSYRTLVGNDIDGIAHGYKIHLLYNLTASPENRTYETLSDQQNLSEFGWKITSIPEAISGHRPTAHAVLDTTRLNPYLVLDLENLLYGQTVVSTPPPLIEDIDGGTPLISGSDILDGGTAISAGFDVLDGGNPLSSVTVPIPQVSNSLDARLPPLQELVDLVENWTLIEIIDHGDGTWTATGPDEFVLETGATSFQITSANALYLDDDTYEITTSHSF